VASRDRRRTGTQTAPPSAARARHRGRYHPGSGERPGHRRAPRGMNPFPSQFFLAREGILMSSTHSVVAQARALASPLRDYLPDPTAAMRAVVAALRDFALVWGPIAGPVLAAVVTG